MIKYIKNLDDSVVREGEVRTFGNFQGIYQNFLNEFQKASGKGFTPEDLRFRIDTVSIPGRVTEQQQFKVFNF